MQAFWVSRTGTTWNTIADELGLLTLGPFTGPAGTFRQTAQRDLPAKLHIAHPEQDHRGHHGKPLTAATPPASDAPVITPSRGWPSSQVRISVPVRRPGGKPA